MLFRSSNTSSTITSVLSREVSHGFSHVVSEARNFALPVAVEYQPGFWEDGDLGNRNRFLLYVPNADTYMDASLSMTLEERSDFKVYRLHLNLKKTSEYSE